MAKSSKEKNKQTKTDLPQTIVPRRSTWLQIAFVISLLFLLGLLWFLKDVWFSFPKGVFYRNFGSRQVSSIFMNGFALLIMFFFLGVLIWLIYTALEMRMNYRFWVTLFIMLFLFYIGLQLIDSEVGARNITFKLRDVNDRTIESSGRVVGEINCSGTSRVPIVGDKVFCSMNPRLDNYSAWVNFALENGSTVPTSIGELSFIAPENVVFVSFNIEGVDDAGNLRELATGASYSFLTEDGWKQHRAKFASYVLGLLGLIFFSVPPMVLNILKLLNRST